MLKRRRPAPVLRPDLTPFVSVALLLIVFFVWMKQLERSSVSTLIVPPNHFVCAYAEPLQTNAILFLVAHNRVDILHFVPDNGIAEFVETDYSQSGLKRFLETIKRPDHRVTLIIKPTAQATIGNIVSVLNELKYPDKLPFILSDVISPDETKLLANYSTHKISHPRNRYPLVITMPLYQRGSSPVHFLTPALPIRQWGY